jgi:hypothetical protein
MEYGVSIHSVLWRERLVVFSGTTHGILINWMGFQRHGCFELLQGYSIESAAAMLCKQKSSRKFK